MNDFDDEMDFGDDEVEDLEDEENKSDMSGANYLEGTENSGRER